MSVEIEYIPGNKIWWEMKMEIPQLNIEHVYEPELSGNLIKIKFGGEHFLTEEEFDELEGILDDKYLINEIDKVLNQNQELCSMLAGVDGYEDEEFMVGLNLNLRHEKIPSKKQSTFVMPIEFTVYNGLIDLLDLESKDLEKKIKEMKKYQ